MGIKTIKIMVPRKGLAKGTRQITMEANGYQGTSCKSATAAFEQALGSVSSVQEKPEMYEVEQGVEREHQG